MDHISHFASAIFRLFNNTIFANIVNILWETVAQFLFQCGSQMPWWHSEIYTFSWTTFILSKKLMWFIFQTFEGQSPTFLTPFLIFKKYSNREWFKFLFVWTTYCHILREDFQLFSWTTLAFQLYYCPHYTPVSQWKWLFLMPKYKINMTAILIN